MGFRNKQERLVKVHFRWKIQLKAVTKCNLPRFPQKNLIEIVTFHRRRVNLSVMICLWLYHGHISSLTFMNYNHEIAVKSHKNPRKTIEIWNFLGLTFWFIYFLPLSKYILLSNPPDLARKSQNINLILHMHFSVQLWHLI